MGSRQQRLRNELRAAGDEYKACKTSLNQARDHVQPRMVAALKGGVGVIEVADLSGYTRERVRTLARQNGIDGKI